MHRQSIPFIILNLFLIGFINNSIAQTIGLPAESPERLKAELFVNEQLNTPFFNYLTGYFKKDSTRIDTLLINFKSKTVALHLDPKFAYTPMRETTVEYLTGKLRDYLGESYRNYKVTIYSNEKNISAYIPNYYISDRRKFDKDRMPKKFNRKSEPVVKNLSKPNAQPTNLYNINIALWPSHGYYYEQKLNRWEWQRSRLFQTVEDIFPMAFAMQGLVPMLENAGATIFIPRERDWQTHEVIVDNNGSTGSSIYRSTMTIRNEGAGFAIGSPPYINENPFKLGTYIEFSTNKIGKDSVEWIPDIPEEGYYPVYISYHHTKINTDKALYTVYHCSGKTEFQVNQQMGGSTWIYLGKFKFRKGLNEINGKVVLSSKGSKNGQLVTADAVRFGAGMGNINRNGIISRKPRYQEAARYYLQYSGIPDSLVWKTHGDTINDYIDDYQCRGEWVDYLMGAPSGPKIDKNTPGLSIPIDFAFALHTDAGIAHNDSLLGTLGIYSTTENSFYYPNGLSKMASRDLTDLIQSQIVEDLRVKYDSAWVRRAMWDKPYSEAYRPNVPTMLLELLSHQNFKDVRYAQDPQFRFDVCRAIYKGMLRFLSFQNHFEFTVQPLPVSHFQLNITQNSSIQLKWEPTTDALESTATARGYVVYTRINDDGFDNGTFVKEPYFELHNVKQGTIYSFKIAAWNRGGESFPSEILSACIAEDSKDTVLIINGFDRLSAPASINEEHFSGFIDGLDQGVGYHYNLHTTGAQFNFDPLSPWLDDDSPGHGASGAELEGKIIPGNSFDFSYIHGKAIKNAGYSFVSVSDESVTDKQVDLNQYKAIDYLAGEEKTTCLPNNHCKANYMVFPDSLLYIFSNFLNQGGNLFLSGSYIGTDVKTNQQDSLIGAILKYKWRTGHASRLGNAYFCDTSFALEQIQFNTQYHPTIYTVEAPDAIEPCDTNSYTLMRYTENNMSAAVGYQGSCRVLSVGFPFESIISETERDAFMKKGLEFLLNKDKISDVRSQKTGN